MNKINVVAQRLRVPTMASDGPEIKPDFQPIALIFKNTLHPL